MPTATVNPAARRTFVLDSFRVQGAKSPHGNPQTAKELVPYCEEVVCEGLYAEVMDAVARQDPALATIAGVCDDYLHWAIDMTMYYFVISSLKARGIVNSLDATDYFTFQFPKPEKWVKAEDAATSSTAAFGEWMSRREGEGSRLPSLPAQSPSVQDANTGSSEEEESDADIDIVAEKLAAANSTQQEDMDELVNFMNQVVL
ncbi:hypothetical protein MKZ38_004500 [Zalerion maritima]|uniref:Uncharacterized protein n=1 Tax=Zalerion maritima TaxID=339359 RepID=A0AAD5RMK8_9PEZI|nr:hypothetical protein MKZ38_004500 [Zalerion maritima]